MYRNLYRSFTRAASAEKIMDIEKITRLTYRTGVKCMVSMGSGA